MPVGADAPCPPVAPRPEAVAQPPAKRRRCAGAGGIRAGGPAPFVDALVRPPEGDWVQPPVGGGADAGACRGHTHRLMTISTETKCGR